MAYRNYRRDADAMNDLMRRVSLGVVAGGVLVLLGAFIVMINIH